MYKCEWLITHPDGRTEVIDNLNAFCKKFGLNRGSMGEVARGHRQTHKKFKCQKLSEKKIEEILSRNCPECGKIIVYSDKFCALKAARKSSSCKACANTGKLHSKETKKKFSLLRKGKHFSPKTQFKKGSFGALNPRFGKTNYEAWLEKYGKEGADKRMAAFKEKQSKNSSGSKNPMYGKPAPPPKDLG